jgi:hypothetical protein
LEGDVLRRTWLVVVLAAILGGALPGAASGSVDADTTWAQAAATVGFPLWQPRATLGLEANTPALHRCSAPPLPRSYVSATWGAGRRTFSVIEAHPSPCGDAGEARLVRRATVGGVKVRALVNCHSRTCRVKASDGVKYGYHLYLSEPGAKRTLVQVDAVGLPLRDLFTMVRSLVKVPATGAVVQRDGFLSPDRGVWCQITTDGNDDAWCVSRGTPQHGGRVRRDGTVILCNAPVCTQNWDTRSPVLRAGQRSEVGGYRCAAGADASITCTVIATGRGFAISGGAEPAREVGPGAAASAAPEHVQNARLGALRAQYAYDGLPTLARHARIRIWSGGRLIVNRSAGGLGPGYGGRRGGAARALAVRQLDATGPPEVVLNLYSGGAHCCWETWIFTGAHRARQAWGHALPVLRDADGDGAPELHGLDTSFAYAFGPFATSRFPAEVWRYAGGAVTNVSSSFPDEIRADQATQYAAYLEARDARAAQGVRAALAAYAADGYRLGTGDQAMAVVQAAVAAGETDTDKDDGDGFWMPDYLGTLRGLLGKLGYA